VNAEDDSGKDIPVLEPDLDLSRSKARYLSREAITGGDVWMGLSGELAHQEASLLMGEPVVAVAW